MSIRHFIGASSAVLLAWLGATYFHKVPAERYPQQKRTSAKLEVGISSKEIVATVDPVVSARH
ncbi:hypothetical protein ACFSSA_11580 [Luteolibacter algae]|uniref:Efflux transporter periplasmic adaptor subunit n=1 Tax=Luteolibacter algae TaxID=454151 RepID=A0ABW5D8D6_9BACT